MKAQAKHERSGAKILLVEDDPACAAVMREMLRMLGALVDLAHTAEQAEVMFHAAQPCAVITDDAMPGQGGVWLARRLKSAAPEVPVIMLSGAPPESAGSVCDKVLAKPIRIRDLANALASVGCGLP